jgi:hypothetical protein
MIVTLGEVNMTKISDESHNRGYECYLELLGKGRFFHKPEFIIEQPLYRYRGSIDYAI